MGDRDAVAVLDELDIKAPELFGHIKADSPEQCELQHSSSCHCQRIFASANWPQLLQDGPQHLRVILAEDVPRLLAGYEQIQSNHLEARRSPHALSTSVVPCVALLAHRLTVALPMLHYLTVALPTLTCLTAALLTLHCLNTVLTHCSLTVSLHYPPSLVSLPAHYLVCQQTHFNLHCSCKLHVTSAGCYRVLRLK